VSVSRTRRRATPAPRANGSDRFLFYSHDALGLGHVRRNLSVAGALTELAPEASVLVATSTAEAESLGVPQGVDILKLPGLRKMGNERYTSRKLHLSGKEVRTFRAELLAAAVTGFRPAVMLVDKHPLGVGGELSPALDAARAYGTRAVLGLRDVLDDLSAVDAEWRRRGVFERIADLYDRVLVYGQPDLFDPLSEYHFPDDVAAICSFCGYVIEPAAHGSGAERPNGHPAPAPSDEPVVLATAGGGEDGFDLLATFLEAAAEAHWQAMVVTGSQCPPKDAERLSRLAAEAGVEFRRFVPGLAAQFGSLDALVCMGGYNTLAEAAASGVATVCIPRVRPRREQLIRARMFERRGLLTLVEPRRLDAGVLKAEVESAIERENPGGRRRSEGALDIGGAPRAARHLLEVAAGTVATRAAAKGGRL
jgi:predicted glycosyltransferase